MWRGSVSHTLNYFEAGPRHINAVQNAQGAALWHAPMLSLGLELERADHLLGLDLGVELPLVVEEDADRRGPVHDVGVRDDVAARREEDPAARAPPERLCPVYGPARCARSIAGPPWEGRYRRVGLLSEAPPPASGTSSLRVWRRIDAGCGRPLPARAEPPGGCGLPGGPIAFDVGNNRAAPDVDAAGPKCSG